DPMSSFLKKFWRDQQGQDLVEYALLLVFLALAAITALPALGQAVSNVFVTAKSTLESGS
ncbi:MAG: Flp family type IVb pilin, partial [Terriglobia bacterium]